MANYEISFTESALDDLAWFKKREQNELEIKFTKILSTNRWRKPATAKDFARMKPLNGS